MIYAGGLKLLLLSAILYALGSILFVLARREQQENTFASAEWLIFAVVVIAASLVFAA
jgi:arginine:ornithine antiporter/lysine permease